MNVRPNDLLRYYFADANILRNGTHDKTDEN